MRTPDTYTLGKFEVKHRIKSKFTHKKARIIPESIKARTNTAELPQVQHTSPAFYQYREIHQHGRMPVIRTARQSRTWDISNIKKDILCLKNLFLVLLLLGSVLIFEESFALSPRPPPDLTKLEISNAPKLHEEFELTILLVPYYYNENFEKDSGKEKSPITFAQLQFQKILKLLMRIFLKE